MRWYHWLKMNRTQKMILFLGFILIAMICLRPPYQWEHKAYIINRNAAATVTEKIGHYWIWAPPRGWEEIPYPMVRKSRVASVDWPRLGVYVGLAATITLIIIIGAHVRAKLHRYLRRN